MIKIELKQQNGKTKTFIQEFVSGRKLRNMLVFFKKLEKDDELVDELEMLDGLVNIVANLFDDDLVNYDSIWDGIEASKLAETLREVLDSAMGKEEKANSGAVTIEKALESLDDLYRQLLENGWTLNDIEECDINLLLKLYEDKTDKEVLSAEDFFNMI